VILCRFVLCVRLSSIGWLVCSRLVNFGLLWLVFRVWLVVKVLMSGCIFDVGDLVLVLVMSVLRCCSGCLLVVSLRKSVCRVLLFGLYL